MLTTARVLLFALAPILELEHAIGPPASQQAVVTHESTPDAPLHRASVCPACLLLHTHAWQPDANVVSLRTVERRETVSVPVVFSLRSATRDTRQSRAPPAVFV